jgi:hypothetical protein
VATVAGAAGAAALAAAAVAVAALSVQAHRQRLVAEESRAAAEAQAAEARRQLYFSNVMLAAEARDRDNLAEARQLLAAARQLAGSDGGPEPIEVACVAATLDEAIDALPGHGGTVTSVGWSADGRGCVTGDDTGMVRIWRPAAADTSGHTCQAARRQARGVGRGRWRGAGARCPARHARVRDRRRGGPCGRRV